jgi:ABC-2 type transport system permease protein
MSSAISAPTAPTFEHPRGGPISSSPITALLTLYWLTIRQYVNGKRWMVMCFLFLLPAALVVLIRTTAREIPPNGIVFLISYMLVPQALLPLLGLVYSSGLVQDEQEEQTITYILSRPISKWAMYLIKLLATLTTTVVLTALFTMLTYLAIYVGTGSQQEDAPLRCLQSIGIHCLAVIAYCCLFGLISIWTNRILIYGILYIVIVEGVLANLPFGIRLLTVVYYVRIIAYRTFDFVVLGPNGRSEDIAADAWQLNVSKDPGLLEHPQTGTAIATLLIASLVCALLAAFFCSRKEFYVKTPEKN